MSYFNTGLFCCSNALDNDVSFINLINPKFITKIIKNNDSIIAVIIMLLLFLDSIFKFHYSKADHKLHHNINAAAFFNIRYTGI